MNLGAGGAGSHRHVADATATVSDTRPYPVDMYVRFTNPTVMNQQLIYQGHNIYAMVLSLVQNVYAFQIADLANTAARRFAMNATSARFLTIPGSTSLVSGVRAAAVMVINPAGTIRFELNATNSHAPVLTLTRP